MAMKTPWHAEDIKAAVRKKGKTLKALAESAGLSNSAVKGALSRPLFCGEQAIAEFLGIEPKAIWPDRYDPDGTPKHPQARRRHLSENANGGHARKIAA